MKVEKNSVLRKCITQVIFIVFILTAFNIINMDTAFSEPGDETDTRLAELSVRCGELVPEFSPDIYEYKVYVTEDQEIKSCMAAAEAMNYLSNISVEGATEFSDEDVERKITVTGISGEKSEYTIKFHIIRDSSFFFKHFNSRISLILPSTFSCCTENSSENRRNLPRWNVSG